jgi:hypothetical protein
MASTSSRHNPPHQMTIFLLQPLTELKVTARQAVCAINQTSFMRCLWVGLMYNKMSYSIKKYLQDTQTLQQNYIGNFLQK